MENTTEPATIEGPFDRAYRWSFQRRLGLNAYIPCSWGVACLVIALLTGVRWQSLVSKQAETTQQGIALSRLSLVCPNLLDVAFLYRSGGEPDFLGRANPLRQRLKLFEQQLEELQSDAETTSDLRSLQKQMLDLCQRMINSDPGSFHADVEATAICSLVESAINDRSVAIQESQAEFARQGRYLAYGLFGCMFCGLTGAFVGAGHSRVTDRRLIRLTEFMKARAERPKRVRRQPDLPTAEEILPKNEEKDLLQEFKDKLTHQVTQLRSLVGGDNYSEVSKIATWLLGAAGTLGFSQFTEVSQLLEAAAQSKNAEDVERLSQQIEQLADGLLVNQEAST